jgi:hypothetical protein
MKCVGVIVSDESGGMREEVLLAYFKLFLYTSIILEKARKPRENSS